MDPAAEGAERPQGIRDGRERERAERMAEGALPALRERGLRRLALTFVNHAGNTLVKVVPLERLVAVARDGVGFSPVADAWTVEGLPDPLHSLAVPDGDLRLIPDLEALLPLEVDGGWAWAPADRHHRDGTPYACDQRLFCRRLQNLLEAEGVGVRAGFEIEWVVGHCDEGGTLRPAVAGGPYGADRLVDGLDYAAALADALDAAGLPWLQLHPEYGAGQFELSLAPSDLLTAADRMVAARLLIQRITRRHGWHATFSPLPDPARVGNGGHLHLSVTAAGQRLLEGGPAAGGLTTEGAGLLGSLLRHLPALLAIACPLAVSYRRLGPARWSAPFQVWGVENREAALRLIPADRDGTPAQLEIKVADGAVHPYLLTGAVAALVREGLRHPLPLPEPVSGDPSLRNHLPPRLPEHLEAASEAFADCGVLRDAFGEPLHQTLRESQQAEVRRAATLDEDRLIASTRWLPPARP